MRGLRIENVWLNDISLRDVDARIINVKVIEPDATEDIGYAALPGRDGQLILRHRRQSKKIQVQFGIRELFDLPRRTEAIDAVNRWARDGVLMVSTRPDRMAQVTVTKWASIADAREYTGSYTLEFEAAGIPYWQDATPQKLTLSGTAASGQITVTGSAETVLDAKITPASGTLTTLSITLTDAALNTKTMAFSGLSATGAVSITHDAQGILRMSSGMLAKRTAASVDDLFAEPGIVTVGVTANVSCSAEITARGRWR